MRGEPQGARRSSNDPCDPGEVKGVVFPSYVIQHPPLNNLPQKKTGRWMHRPDRCTRAGHHDLPLQWVIWAVVDYIIIDDRRQLLIFSINLVNCSYVFIRRIHVVQQDCYITDSLYNEIAISSWPPPTSRASPLSPMILPGMSLMGDPVIRGRRHFSLVRFFHPALLGSCWTF